MKKLQRHYVFNSVLPLIWPLVLANATDVVMRFSDQYFLSRFPGDKGEALLAAALNGGVAVETFSLFVIMIMTCVNSLAAQYVGAGRPEESAKIAYHGLAIAIFIYPLFQLVRLLLPPLFHFFGHAPEMIADSIVYASPLIWMSIFTFARAALSSFFTGVGRPRVTMWANLLAIVCNIPLNIILIFGFGPIPALGLAGTAWATGASNAISTFILLVIFLKRNSHQRYQTRKWHPLQLQYIGKIFRYGSPSGFEALFNMTAINILTLSIGTYGNSVATALSLTFNWELLILIPLTGVSQAVTSLAGKELGAGRVKDAQRTILPTLTISYVYVLPMLAIFLFWPELLLGVFTMNMENPDQVVGLASTMLRMTAIYLIGDVVAQAFIGFLRAAGDTLGIMIIVAAWNFAMSVTVLISVRWWQASPILCWLFYTLMILAVAASLFLLYRSGRWKKLAMIQ